MLRLFLWGGLALVGCGVAFLAALRPRRDRKPKLDLTLAVRRAAKRALQQGGGAA